MIWDAFHSFHFTDEDAERGFLPYPLTFLRMEKKKTKLILREHKGTNQPTRFTFTFYLAFHEGGKGK